jgi:hypothetical protein
VNHNRIVVERVDAGVQSASGTMELQDASQFTQAGITGNYAFNLSGANGSNTPGSLAVAGAFTSNGTGSISSGKLDVNRAGTPLNDLSLTGSYTAPSAAGRGTMTLTSTFLTQNFFYYIVDATHVKLVETDALGQLVGDVYKQPAGPFTNASIRNGFAFAFLGSSGGNPFGEGGVITLSGAGTVTGGTMDSNANGTPRNGQAVSGTYAVADAATGRTTVTLTVGTPPAQQLYVFYPQMNGALSVVEVDTSNVVAGRALPQTSGFFSNGSFQGDYALNFSGTDFSPLGEMDIVGHAVPNGGGSIGANGDSKVDVSANGTLASAALLSGSYSCDALCTSSGRGSATLQTNSATFSSGGFHFYIADTGDLLFLETDSNRVLVGIAQRQF